MPLRVAPDSVSEDSSCCLVQFMAGVPFVDRCLVGLGIYERKSIAIGPGIQKSCVSHNPASISLRTMGAKAVSIYGSQTAQISDLVASFPVAQSACDESETLTVRLACCLFKSVRRIDVWAGAVTHSRYTAICKRPDGKSVVHHDVDWKG